MNIKTEIDVATLKDTIIRKNTTLEALAFEMGIARSTLYRKLRKGSAGITLKDATTIASCLELSEGEAVDIFGGSYVAYM